METNVNNFHAVGRDMESYRGGALIEAVTLKSISIPELIGRYNLMIEYIAEQAQQLEAAREIIDMVSHEWTPVKQARAWLAANPAPQAEQLDTIEE